MPGTRFSTNSCSASRPLLRSCAKWHETELPYSDLLGTGGKPSTSLPPWRLIDHCFNLPFADRNIIIRVREAYIYVFDQFRICLLLSCFIIFGFFEGACLRNHRTAEASAGANIDNARIKWHVCGERKWSGAKKLVDFPNGICSHSKMTKTSFN